MPGVHSVAPATMEDGFPYAEWDRPDVPLLRCKEFLAPLIDSHQLYYDQSHWHWTPLAHRVSAKQLAAVVEPMLR